MKASNAPPELPPALEASRVVVVDPDRFVVDVPAGGGTFAGCVVVVVVVVLVLVVVEVEVEVEVDVGGVVVGRRIVVVG